MTACRRRVVLTLGAGGILGMLLGGCAAPAAVGPGPSWRGRIAVQVEGRPEQSFSAAFELAGSAREGELVLLSPIGHVLGQLQWAPGRAVLIAQGEPRSGHQVESLIESVVGTSIPLSALFDWLNGQATAAAGWETDLTHHAHGRLRARRVSPAPVTELRIALDR